MIEIKGQVTTQLTPEGINYFHKIFTAPKKSVMTVDPLTMSKFRKIPAGGVLEIVSASSGSAKFKILRRDWKRCKLHLLEIK